MRALTLFTATLAVVLGVSFAAQAATLTVSSDKSTYAVSEIITLTVSGDSTGIADVGVRGSLNFDNALLSSVGAPTQTVLRTATDPWLVGGLLVNNPGVTGASVDSFSQINGATTAKISTKKLTAVMTFHADASGVANFSWATTGVNSFDFFGLTNATGLSVTIVPEPTTAGLMGLGVLGLVIAGRRRKS